MIHYFDFLIKASLVLEEIVDIKFKKCIGTIFISFDVSVKKLFKRGPDLVLPLLLPKKMVS